MRCVMLVLGLCNKSDAVIEFQEQFRLEEGLCMQLIEPIAYRIYANEEEHASIRFTAQETLTVMSEHLDKMNVLESILECTPKELYDAFCDRLDLKRFPFIEPPNTIQYQINQ